jgi:membrane protein required for beta-lactamase induction
LADILLWVLIVCGPFALMGWGLWALVRKVRKS